LPSRPLSLGDRLRRFFLEPTGAEVALEFSSEGVVGAAVARRRGGVELRSIAREALAEGSFAPALENPGFKEPDRLRDAVKRVLGRIEAGPGCPSALVVPDILARFRLFSPDEVRPEPGNRDSVITFRMQKLVPFPAAEARVRAAWPRSPVEPVLGIAFSATVMGAFEQLGEAFGLDVGSVETSSMALLRAIDIPGDALLIRHDPAWVTVTLVRNSWPISIRTLDPAVAASAEELRRELATTAVFWRDRLEGEQLSAAWVHASDSWHETLAPYVASEFGCVPERVQPPAGLVIPGIPRDIERVAAPALALLGAGGR